MRLGDERISEDCARLPVGLEIAPKDAGFQLYDSAARFGIQV